MASDPKKSKLDMTVQNQKFYIMLNKMIKKINKGREPRKGKIRKWIPDVRLEIENLNLYSSQFKTAEETSNFKRQLNLISYCCALIRGASIEGIFKSDKADALLDWQFDSDEALIKKARSELSEGFLRSFVCELWRASCVNRNVDTAKEECTKALNWVLPEDQVESFKKEQMIADEVFFKSPDIHWGTIDKFIEFCGTPSEKLAEMKKNILEDVNNWLEELVLEEYSVKIADGILSWITKNKKEKKEILHEFMSSDRGAYVLAMMVYKCGKNYRENLRLMFNSWVKDHVAIDDMRRNLNDIDYNCIKTKYQWCIDEWLSILDKGRKVTFKDFKQSFDDNVLEKHKMYEQEDSDDYLW